MEPIEHSKKHAFSNLAKRILVIGLTIALYPNRLANINESRYGNRPNVILALIDNLGWRGLGSYGNDPHLPPNTDRFASQAALS